MTNYLSIQGVTKRFDDFVAVRDVSLNIASGEFVTLLGPSGSGKSTLLSMIAGLSDPSTGDITMKGRSLLGVPPNRRNIGMVFQRYTLIPHMSASANIEFPLKMRGWSRARIAARLEEMLALVKLQPFAHRKPADLSGGQQQRVALARALAYEPEILLMDEPLAALDKRLKEDLQFEIRRIHREVGTTIVYVTHDQEEALRLSDRIAVFNHGEIEQTANGEELYSAPRGQFIAGFVGNSNFLPARVESVEANSVVVSLVNGLSVNDVPLPPSITRPNPGDVGVLLIRPEDLRLSGHGADDGRIPVTILDRLYLGEVVELLVRTAWSQDLKLRGRPADFSGTGAIGSTACLLLPVSGTLFFPDPTRAAVKGGDSVPTPPLSTDRRVAKLNATPPLTVG